MTQNLHRALEAIRSFPHKHPSLMKSHHFLFDLPMDSNTTRCEYIMMGINPGETDADWTHAPRSAAENYPIEASSSYDFRIARKIVKNRSAKNWDTRSKSVLGTSDIFYTELFFWSSRNQKELEKRFGALTDLNDDVLLFCKEQNEVMFRARSPKAVVFSGLGHLNLVSNLYGLTPLRGGRMDLKNGSARLLIAKTDGARPWFFLPHLTGSRGFSREMMVQARQRIDYITAMEQNV